VAMMARQVDLRVNMVTKARKVCLLPMDDVLGRGVEKYELDSYWDILPVYMRHVRICKLG
jgi:hypothetical protein